MTHIRTPAITLLALAALSGCGPKTFDLAPPSADDTLKKAPDWMMELPEKDDRLMSSATATSRDFQVSIDKAQALAQADIARQLSARLSNLTRQFREEVGLAADSQLLSEFSSVTKSLVDETLVGVRVAHRKIVTEGNIYRAYVLMELSLGEANQMLLGKLQSNEALLTRFRATQAYADLETELQDSRATSSH